MRVFRAPFFKIMNNFKQAFIETAEEVCFAVSDGGALVLIGFFIVCAIFGVIVAIFER